MLFLRLLGGLFGFEGLIDHRADEVVQAEITLGRVGVLVYWGVNRKIYLLMSKNYRSVIVFSHLRGFPGAFSR